MQVAIYCRVSTDEQKQGRTIDAQIKELEDLACSRGDTIVARYIDDGWSGSLLNRPQLDALRDDAGERRFEGVLVNDVDRLSRDIANLAVVKRDLERKGVQLIFKNLPNDKSPISNFMVNVLGAFAEFERAMITDRTRRGRRFKVQERHLIMGNIPPYGYDYVKKDKERGVEGYYEVNSEEGRVVRMMYQWVVSERLSQRAVARRLNELAIPARRSRRWAKSSVHRVLTNETYAGVTYYNKNQVLDSPKRSLMKYRAGKTGRRLRDRSEWIPIPLREPLHLVDRTMFEQVQMEIARNRAFSARNGKYFYLLREVRRVCSDCGGSFAGTPYHGRRFYRCTNRDSLRVASGKRRCTSRIVSAGKIEDAVWKAVTKAVQNPNLIAAHVTKLYERHREAGARAEAQESSLRRDLDAVNQEEDRLVAAYRTGVISLPQLEKEIAHINQRRVALEKVLSAAKVELPPPQDVVVRDVSNWCAIARRRLDALDDREKQQFLGYLLTEIIIEGDALRIRGQVPSPAINPDNNGPSVKEPGAVVGNIVPIPVPNCGRNAAYAFELSVELV